MKKQRVSAIKINFAKPIFVKRSKTSNTNPISPIIISATETFLKN